MDNMGVLEKQKSVFAKLFLLANRLQVRGDKVFPDVMSIRQWILTVAIARYGDNPPKLVDMAELMGSSHQNIKELAKKLCEKGFIRFEKDPRDLRATRIRLTEKSWIFWENRQIEIMKFLKELFSDFSKEELELLYEGIEKLHDGVVEVEKIKKKEGCFK